MIRRLLLLDHPTETRFFLFVGAFGLVLAAAYWLLTYEVAGTILLLGFGLGAGILGFVLLRSRPRAYALSRRRRPAAGREDVRTGDAIGAGDRLDDGPAREPDTAGAGTSPADATEATTAADTPFDDPTGRVPGETLAPLSLGLGVALGLTALVFGPWLLVAGLLPLAWGAWTWLSGARDELEATEEDEIRATAEDVAARRPAVDAGIAVAASEPGAATPEPRR